MGEVDSGRRAFPWLNFLLIPPLLDMAFIVGSMALSDVQRLDLGSDDEAEAMQSASASIYPIYP